jgi:predicted nucleic acid-binding protein
MSWLLDTNVISELVKPRAASDQTRSPRAILVRIKLL